eukprot:415211-Rhodomonas_salina.2
MPPLAAYSTASSLCRREKPTPPLARGRGEVGADEAGRGARLRRRDPTGPWSSPTRSSYGNLAEAEERAEVVRVRLCCYVGRGTDLGYTATRCALLRYAMLLRLVGS